MNDALIVLTPLVVLLILALFRFTGCTPFDSTPAPANPDPPPPVVPPPTPPPTPPPPPTYEQVIAKTPGFAAHWPLEETAGNVTSVKGMLSPAADGKYITGVPAGTGLKLGQPGVPFKNGQTNLAPEFAGTAAYVEVPYTPQLNPSSSVPGFSIELWVKPNPAAGSNTQILISSRFAALRTGYEISLIRVPNEPHQQVKAQVFSAAVTNLPPVTVQPTGGDPKAWRYIVVTYTGSPSGPGTLTLHVMVAGIAGKFQGGPLPAAYDSVPVANPGTLRFGSGHAGNQGAGSWFAGTIDEIVFYNSVLTPAQMDEHFKML